jgi:hypothetical protein
MEQTRRKSHLEFIVAATAFCVSVGTLGIYVYQAKVMKEQQHVSVWPYMDWNTSNVDDYRIEARNKGIGPAIIRKVDMRVGGKPVDDNAGMACTSRIARFMATAG